MYTTCLLTLLVICLAENNYIDNSEVILREKETASTNTPSANTSLDQTEPAKQTQSMRKEQAAKKAKQPDKKPKQPKKAPDTKTQTNKKKNNKKKNPKAKTKKTKPKTVLKKKTKLAATTKRTKPTKPKPAPKKGTPTNKTTNPKTTTKKTKTTAAPKKQTPTNKTTRPTKKTTPTTKKTTTKIVKHHLGNTLFCVLRDYGSYVKERPEQDFPWIARVIHSKTKDFPHKCTASCIGPRLFLTAARCITILVVEYTHVKYDSVRMPVLAFVVPSNPTKQMFDDVGIIVVEKTSYKGSWPSISLKVWIRTDNDYQWLDKYKMEDYSYGTHVVVGYVKESGTTLDTVYTKFTLSALNVRVGMSLCYEILQENRKNSPDFWVPCYHSCTVKEHYENKQKCFKYLGAAGAAVIDSKTKTLIGIATWGTKVPNLNAPVGIAIPNSQSFFDDLACAKKVLKDNGTTADMQSLCPLPKKTK